MEREVEERFERMESLLHAGFVRGNEMEARFNRRMDRAEQRMDKLDQRMERAEQRMEKFDRRLEAMSKLMQLGIRRMVRLEEGQKALTADVRELAKLQKLFLDSLRRGGNGSHRRA